MNAGQILTEQGTGSLLTMSDITVLTVLIEDFKDLKAQILRNEVQHSADIRMIREKIDELRDAHNADYRAHDKVLTELDVKAKMSGRIAGAISGALMSMLVAMGLAMWYHFFPAA